MNVPAQFDKAMLSLYRRARDEAGYTASIYKRMLEERGSLTTAKSLIGDTGPSGFFTQLRLRKRLDLSVEALVIENEKWQKLFSDDEIAIATKRLKKHRYIG